MFSSLVYYKHNISIFIEEPHLYLIMITFQRHLQIYIERSTFLVHFTMLAPVPYHSTLLPSRSQP